MRVRVTTVVFDIHVGLFFEIPLQATKMAILLKVCLFILSVYMTTCTYTLQLLLLEGTKFSGFFVIIELLNLLLLLKIGQCFI